MTPVRFLLAAEGLGHRTAIEQILAETIAIATFVRERRTRIAVERSASNHTASREFPG